MNFSKKIHDFFKPAITANNGKGAFKAILVGMRLLLKWAEFHLEFYYYKFFKLNKLFIFHDRSYKYFYHRFNKTWQCERTVEIPIIYKIIQESHMQRILEIGNVLSNYFPVTHDILDKCEKAPGVINEDIVNFNPVNKYDAIISISTFEHIGWDEYPRDPLKIIRAIDHLKDFLLRKGGTIVITLPIGFNTVLDKQLDEGKIIFTNSYCLKRISKDNRWIETNWNDIKNSKYNHPYPRANGLVVGYIK